jgi:hypothetical protein
MKKVLLRTDMLRKVKQYDGILSNVLQVFQVCREYSHPSNLLKMFLQTRLALAYLEQVIQRQRNV